MLSTKLEQALNAQVNAEFWSAYLYLSMSYDFASKGLPGFASWMNVQFQEEQSHALKLLNYIVSRGGKPILEPIAAVQTAWESPLAAFEATLSHEQKVSVLINDLYGVALDERDFAAQSMLKWFIDEQVEEEESVHTILDALRLIQDNGFGLYQLDKEMAARVFTAPAL